jgi:hypothetical protein
MTIPGCHRGYMLVTVLIITAIGLLFGAGALLLFRFQCQLRIDRQHELEKVYAVRSVLNYIRTYIGEIYDTGKWFTYHTGSDRNLRLTVQPVAAIFPDVNNGKHFDMERSGSFTMPCPEQYNTALDYEYGVESWPEIKIAPTHTAVGGGKAYGLAFNDLEATNNVRWWVNIGMRDTGGWLQEDYGRRYCFWPRAYVDGNNGGLKDVMRLCIIRNVTNDANTAGYRHGWPLSCEGERALVFEINPKAATTSGATNNAEIVFYEYVYTGGALQKTERLRWSKQPADYNMGLQIADNKVSLFYIGNEGLNTTRATVDAKLMSRGYTFSDSLELTLPTYRYFAEPVSIGGKAYGGIWTNSYGRVQAPELRAVFEVEAASDKRATGEVIGNANVDFLTRFKVTPAYQYDVFLEHPTTITNRATVAQKIGRYKREGTNYTILTYDTHGTEHKGFRRDEREFERNGAQ